MKKLSHILIAASILITAGSTFAQTVEWNSDGMSCVPTHETAEAQKYATVAGGVKFKPGATGMISFTCPFAPLGLKRSRAYHLEMAIRDLTPGRDLAGVTAQVRVLDPVNGNVVTALTTDPAQRTNSSTGNVATVRSDSKLFGWNPDYTYYVQFTIRRSRRTIDPNKVLAEPLPELPDPLSVFRLALIRD